jgi:hypothetical protein
MGEGTPGLDALGGQIAEVREELDTLLGELDRRRHEALDVPLQLRRHAVGASLTVVALVAAAAASVWLTLWRRRRRDRLSAQAGRLRRAVSRMTEHPERVAAEPTIPARIATAAANAAVAALVKKALERAVESLMSAGADGTAPRGRWVEPRGAARPHVLKTRRESATG